MLKIVLNAMLKIIGLKMQLINVFVKMPIIHKVRFVKAVLLVVCNAPMEQLATYVTKAGISDHKKVFVYVQMIHYLLKINNVYHVAS
jgi:hypothetical protein